MHKSTLFLLLAAIVLITVGIVRHANVMVLQKGINLCRASVGIG